MNAPKPKRRWFQFSLRTLLVFVTLCAIVCSWLAVKMKEAKREREIATKIETLGGNVVWSKPTEPEWLQSLLWDDLFRRVSYVSLRGTQFSDANLGLLEGLNQLQELNIEGSSMHVGWTHFTDNGLGHLKGLNRLQSLWLVNCRITDDGLDNLNGLNQLQRLFLYDTHVTDVGVKKLQQALPNCKIER